LTLFGAEITDNYNQRTIGVLVLVAALLAGGTFVAGQVVDTPAHTNATENQTQ